MKPTDTSDVVFLDLASVDRLHVEGMSEYEGDLLF